MKALNLTGKILLFILLTVLTQIGGLVYLITLSMGRRIDKRFMGRLQRTGIKFFGFVLIYLLCSLLLVPLIARPFGRVPLPMTKHNNLRPLTIWTCLLNRNYVRPELRELAERAALKMDREYPGTVVNYLDACFPFINRFPLFPHLSHNDGKKLDFSFCYLDSKTGGQINGAPSAIGYGICEEPRAGEQDQPCFCRENGYWEYNLMRKIMPQGNKQNYLFDSARTKALVKLFIEDDQIGKIFIEPHLKIRLGLERYDKIRYHGCHAVRHDDHFHVQL